ncbi:MAG TPA: DUF2182 domain-containing protein [Actinomycetes bacterium]
MAAIAAPPTIVRGRARGVRASLVGTVVVAWVVLLLWARSSAASYLDHDGLAHPSLVRVLLLALGWLLMTAAMMLPASITYVGRLTERSRLPTSGGRLLGLLAGFVLVWWAFGVAATLSDLGVHRLVGANAGLTARAWLVFPITLTLAGAYQLSRTKRRALVLCRDPVPALCARWDGPPRTGPLSVGLRHGIDCVGSCAGLMLVVFAVGMSNVLGMVAGTVAALAERYLGGRAPVVIGGTLVVSALFMRVSG